MTRVLRIWTGKRWRYFATIQAASDAAAAIHRETGIFVAIEDSRKSLRPIDLPRKQRLARA